MPENIESKIRTESGNYNQGTKNAQLIHEIRNAAENWQPILDKIKSGKARDISDEPKIVDNKNCFILGSGPSLDDSIQYLKEWKGGIICTTSHALTLMYYGIEPTHILVLDPFCQWSEIEGVDWSKTRTKLIIHPGCRPDLIEKWPNDILLYVENAGRTDSFYQDELMKMYSWRDGDYRMSTFHFYVRTGITIFACSPPMQLFAGELLGYEKFFLAGCDFAFHSDKERFTDYIVDDIVYLDGTCPNNRIFKNNILWEKHEHSFNPDNPKLIQTNSGLLSEQTHIYYLKNLISAWRLCGKTMYSTDHGAMIQVPYHDIKAVIKKQGDFPIQSKFFINDTCDKYLGSCGSYVLETNKGVTFVESEHYEMELPVFMKEAMSRYHCDKCGIVLNANLVIYRFILNGENKDFSSASEMLNAYMIASKDNTNMPIQVIDISEINHSDESCPNCKEGKLIRDVNIDIEENMNRIKKYSKKE